MFHLKKSHRKPRVVVIDDDPGFANLLSHVATRSGFIAKVFGGIDEVLPETLQDADVLVLDYDLGNTTGLDIGKTLESQRIEKPILLVSADERAFKQRSWPANIRSFAAKSLGVFGVMQSVRELALSGT